MYAVGDVYATQEALPPRFQPRAQWLAANQTINTTYRFVASGDADEPSLVSSDRTRMLGRRLNEVSTYTGASATPTSGGTILTYGDVAAGFRIIDRVGMSVELVPHLFGTNRRPTGQRGLYAYWRVGSGVTVPNALRSLVVT